MVLGSTRVKVSWGTVKTLMRNDKKWEKKKVFFLLVGVLINNKTENIFTITFWLQERKMEM